MNLKTLKAVRNIIGVKSKSTLPILESFYIDQDYVYFTDLHIFVRVRHFFPFKEGNTAIVIKSDLFLKRMESIKAPYFISSDENNKILFEMPDSVTKITGDPPTEHPIKHIPVNLETQLFTLSGSDVRLLNTARQFTADDELRPIMQMICVDQDYIVASDAHKLYYRKIGKKHTDYILIDPKAVRLMMLSNDSFALSHNASNFCAVSEDMTIWWKTDQTYLGVQVSSGHYPNWRSVLPKTTNEVTIPVKETLQAINALAFATNAYSHVIKMSIKNNFLMIEAKNIDYGISSTERVSIINKNNAELEFGFKLDFLKEILKVFVDEGRPQISLKFTDSTHSFVFADYVLLMPCVIPESNF